MITPTKYFLFPILFSFIILVTSCSDGGVMSVALVDTISTKEIMKNSVNRAAPEMSEGSSVAISVIYTGNLDHILSDKSSTLYKAIHTYDLNIQDPFQIDEGMKGIVLTSYTQMEDPVDVAKQISTGENVLMVEVKNLPNIDV